MTSTACDDTFLTVVSGAVQTGQVPVYKDKGSRFLAYGYHVSDVAQVQDILRALRAEHHAARHVCFAYRLGPWGDTFRAGDDGEPSGTAGLPIYNQLLSFQVTDTLVAVVRYFGGILLGASGLTAAYKQAARMALEAAQIERWFVMRSLEVRFGYGQLSAVMRLVKEYDAKIVEQDMCEACRIRLSIRSSSYLALQGALQAVFGVETAEAE